MANKGRKRKQSNFNLQDEPILQPPRMMTTEDHPHSAHAQFNVPYRGNTMMMTRTQVGRRIYNVPVDKQQAPSVVSFNHHRHGFMNIPLVGHTGLAQNEATDKQPNNRHREESRIENELMNGSYEQEHEQGSEIDHDITEKETRGPTYMQSIWGRPPNLPRYHVEYNESGQPISGENSKLCHFLGSIARNGKYCPLDVTKWHDMPSKNKIEMLDVVKLRFHAPIIAEKWILSSIWHKWRNWKHFLKTKYWADVPVEHLINERDERVPLDQWIKLLTYWNTEEAKKASKKNKDARAKKIMAQRTGKTSFAQVRAKLTKEKGRPPSRVELFGSCYIGSKGNSSDDALSIYSAMQEHISQLPEGSEDPIGRDDVFAQIMGQDKYGHVRMLGQGICPSDVWGEVPRNTSNRLLMEYQSKIAHLETMLLEQQKYGALQGNSEQHTSAFNSLSNHAATTLPLLAGAYVSLKSLFHPTKIVAKGCIHSTNPSTVVGGQILGSNWCEVNVKVILEPEEQLIRPYDNLQKIADTLGEMIAWPCPLVTPSED